MPKGLPGRIDNPNKKNSQQQMEILEVEAKSAGANLVLTLSMQQITDTWAPANQFDNVSFTLFFDFPHRRGNRELPQLQASMPEQRDWDLAHVAYGWGNYMYWPEKASAKRMGQKLGIAPEIEVDKASGNITLTYSGEQMGISSWQDVFIYVTTWDISGEGSYRDITAQGGEWQFGGAEGDSAKILDAVTLTLSQ